MINDRESEEMVSGDLRPFGLYVITGGPGSGKTTLLEGIEKRRYKIMPEVARVIIREQMVMGGNALPWGDTRRYSELMLSRSVEDYIRAKNLGGLCFFDRGIPDTLAYGRLIGLESIHHIEEQSRQCPYSPIVFILPPWKKIFRTDQERRQDYEEAVATYQQLMDVYQEFGYNLLIVPELSVEKRVDFVLNALTDFYN